MWTTAWNRAGTCLKTNCCLWRRGTLYQLNREHIYRNELALRAVNGELSLAAALGDEKGGALTSFVGMGALKGVDLPAAPLPLAPGDRVVLMSDGVYNALSREELNEALNAPPEKAARALESAIAGKGFSDQDNYTQNAAPTDTDRHGGFAVVFADCHAAKLKKYDFDSVTYYTDRFSGWLGNTWSTDKNNVRKDNDYMIGN